MQGHVRIITKLYRIVRANKGNGQVGRCSTDLQKFEEKLEFWKLAIDYIVKAQNRFFLEDSQKEINQVMKPKSFAGFSQILIKFWGLSNFHS